MNNAGTFTKSGSAATSTICTLFNNTGTVDVQSGTLSLSGGGTDVGAIYKGAGTVNFSGGTRTLDSNSSITGNATFSGGQTTVNGGSGTGLLTVTGGTATFNGAVTTGALAQSGGELNGLATLTATGASAFSGGTQSGSGTTNAQGGAAFSSTGFASRRRTHAATGRRQHGERDECSDQPERRQSEHRLERCGSGILTIGNGATFNDQTTSSGLNIFASLTAAATRVRRRR